MKAFLSHSGKDKAFVRQVGNRLGGILCEYDEYTFEYILSSQAIRQALARADIFVLFLSAASIKSSFVNEEMITALDYRAQGKIRKVLIFSLDDTSYQALPEWLRAVNVVTRLTSANVCARAIEAELFAIAAETEKSADIYIPRPVEEGSLRKVLSQAPGRAPTTIHVIGHLGLGRRTFLQHVLRSMYPRQIRAFVQIKLEKFDGVNELYRKIYDHYRHSSLEDKIDCFVAFGALSETQQAEEIGQFFVEAIAGEEFILLEDEGAGLTEAGDYPSYLVTALSTLNGASRPAVAFVSSRMMPLHFRDKYNQSYFMYLPRLDGDQILELMSFSLRDAEIDFDDDQLRNVCEILDGHPYNAKLAMSAIKNYGLASFLEDQSYLIAWKRRRAEDFLAQIKFDKLEADIMCALHDYRYLSFSLTKAALRAEGKKLAESLRKLEEYCCVERNGTLYSISAPILDAVGRDGQFQRSKNWKRELAEVIFQTLNEYKSEDHAPVALLDAAAIAAIRVGKSSGAAVAMILPSHFLTLARNAYDDDRREECITFARKAYDRRAQLSIDGQVEALRLWGLASIRRSDRAELDKALEELGRFSYNKTARRHHFFLEGFRLRSKKHYELAEKKFLAAYELAPRNHSINRELADLYRNQKDFAEAESYARRAYEIAPTNPYIIDIFLETLLGKMHMGADVDQNEVDSLFRELEKYGDVPGSSFFQTRVAQDLFRQGRKRDALLAANAAIERTPDFLPCHFLRADINLALADSSAARRDLKEINRILDKRGRFFEADEARGVELEIRLLMEEKKLNQARDLLMKSQFIKSKVYHKLAAKLASVINLIPLSCDRATLEWAGRVLAPKIEGSRSSVPFEQEGQSAKKGTSNQLSTKKATMSPLAKSRIGRRPRSQN